MKVLGAGGVVLNKAGEVLLIRDRQGYWVFPKGHLDPGETLQQAAVREVAEETGIVAQVVAELSLTVYTNNKGVPRQIHWYLMQGEGQVQLEDGLSGVGFFEPNEALRILAFPDDVRLLQEAIAKRAD